MVDRDLIKTIVKSIRQADAKQTHAYDTTAVVRRIENGTAWVHIAGGVDETPVKLTISASVGDTVQVRVSGGRAFLVGNATAPPTDDTTAVRVNNRLTATNRVVKKVSQMAGDAFRIAGNTRQYFWFTGEGTDTGAHITEKPQDEFLADPANGGGNLLARSNGVAIRDGTTELAQFSQSGIAFGDEDGTHLQICHSNDEDMSKIITENALQIQSVGEVDGEGIDYTAFITRSIVNNGGGTAKATAAVFGASRYSHSENDGDAGYGSLLGAVKSPTKYADVELYADEDDGSGLYLNLDKLYAGDRNGTPVKLIVKDTFSALNKSANTYYYSHSFDIAKSGYTPIALNIRTNKAACAPSSAQFDGSVTIMSRDSTISGLNLYLDVTYVRNELI